MELSGRILVLGLGISGVAVVDHLLAARAAGADVFIGVADESDGGAVRARAERIEARGVQVELGVSCVSGEWDLVVASPGIPPTSPLMSPLLGKVPVISELELAYRRIGGRWVAVTGTNGKTTVTRLIAHLLCAAGIPAETVGNIGTPAISVADRVDDEVVLVAEVSSFQLAGAHDFRPSVSVLLNITPDHLDWHGSLEAYARDKARIFANQGEDDLAVIDVDDAGSAPFAEEVAASGVDVCRVSAEAAHTGGAYVEDGVLTVDTGVEVVRFVSASSLKGRGAHNVRNGLAATAAALRIGADRERIAEALPRFEPPSHRLQHVATIDGVEYVDDSKATNPDAAVKALQAYGGRAVLLLLGGRNKGSRFTDVAGALSAGGGRAIVFGEAAGEIERDLGATRPVATVARMADAVAEAMRLAASGDVVLLSPACASFDEFDGYAARGDEFARLVMASTQGGEAGA